MTVIGATTDAQVLPTTALGRFPIRPVLEPNTRDEAAVIALKLVYEVNYGAQLPPVTDMEWHPKVGDAAGNQPSNEVRLMRDVLIAHRDACLGRVGTASCRWRRTGTIASALREPGPLRHTEQLFVQKGYLVVTAAGRRLTCEGVERTLELMEEPNELGA